VSNSSSRPSVLHVIVRAGATNSQYNEHCLPTRDERDITVCSLFPADVTPPISIRLVEGDGTARGSARALRRALALGPYDIVHVHAPASGVLTLWVYLTGLRRRRNLVFTVHNSWANFRRRNRAFLYLICMLFPTVVVCGKAAGSSMPRLLRRLSRRKLEVVQNGVDVDRIDRTLEAMPAREPTDGEPRVVSVNRLIPLKDPRTVLDAFVRTRTAGTLTFIGDGPMRAGLATDVLHAGRAEQVDFTGIIERDGVYSLMADADLFVSASRGEGLPVAVLEAMACGCPVVLSDIPPHREIAALAHGVPLVPTGDALGFARVMRRVLTLEPPERRELGRRQRQSVIEHFSVRAMNNAYGEIYMTVIERNQGGRRTPQLVAGGHAADDEEGDGLLSRMQRRLRLVIALVVIGGLAGYGYSQVQQPEYHAQSSLLVGNVIGGPADEDSLNAAATLAASYADLLRREPVLEPVAEQGFADNWRSLQPRVHAQTGDKNPQLVQITATASKRWEAEDLAAAVSEQLVTLTADREVDEQAEFAARQLARLEEEILDTQSRIENLQARIDRDPDGTEAEALVTEVADLREHLSELQIQYEEMLTQAKEVSNRADVRVLEHAYAAPSALRPDALAMGAAGAGVGLALAAGWVYLSGRRRRTGGSSGHGGASSRRQDPVNGLDRGPRPMRPEPWISHDHSTYIEAPRRENKGR
jgi:glycosyltransferase involved in cell wall biosynthesis/capsular polysaccharide biosynthesis protein